MAIYFAEILCVDKQLSKHLFIKYWKCRQAPDITMILCSNNYDGDEKVRTFVQFFLLHILQCMRNGVIIIPKIKQRIKKYIGKRESKRIK